MGRTRVMTSMVCLMVIGAIVGCGGGGEGGAGDSQGAEARGRVDALEARVSQLETDLVAAQTEVAVVSERLRDIEGVMDRVTVRLDRVDR
ncbi:MAG TPA: hypothetical protein VMS56_14655 [Thermoanaerobaculia bacterium]|nr:hypothetical protein [Thermoanaerobaculia bacterium]